MLNPLTKCTNKAYEFTIYRMLIVFQFADDIWCRTLKNNERDTIYFSFNKTEREDSNIVIYSIVIWKLNIKFGFF